MKGFSGAVFKKFKTNAEAESFIQQKSGLNIQYSVPATTSRAFSSSSSDEPPSKKPKCEMTEEEMIEFILNCDFDEKEQKIKPGTSKNAKQLSDKDWKADRIRMTMPQKTTRKTYGSIEFYEDSDGFVHVYTDGSCENNGKAIAKAGLGVYFGPDHPLNASEAVTGKATNNVGEIQAAIRAITDAQQAQVKRLNIFTDSQFLINSICKWIPAWKSKNWKLSTGKPVANEIDFRKLDELIESGSMLIKWSYIAAHRGYAGNEAADALAKEGAKKYVAKKPRAPPPAWVALNKSKSKRN